ncbi:MAG: hypothetical protein ACSHYB_09600 [Roseibacillus sp.]
MKKTLPILIALPLTQVSFADLIWSEDFEKFEVAQALVQPSATANPEGTDAPAEPTQPVGPWSGAGAGSYKVRNTGTPFGADNKWLQMQGFGDAWTFVNNKQKGLPLATLSFDFYAESEGCKDGWVRVTLNGDKENLAYVDINQNGNLILGQALAKDTALHFDIVVNMTDATVEYSDTSLDSKAVDVWVNGVRLIQSLATSEGSTLLEGFGIWVNNGGTVDAPVDSFNADNFALRDEAFVATADEKH